MKNLNKGLCLSLCAIAMPCGIVFASGSRVNKPSGLRTDLLEHTECVWQQGYRLSHSVEDVQNGAGSLQYAEVRSMRPVFSWEYASDAECEPVSYRIILSDNRKDVEQGAGNVWDSGFVALTPAALPVRYGAESPLEPGKNYFWRVVMADREGRPYEWSDVKVFRTGADLSEFAVSDYPVEKLMGYPVSTSLADGNVLFADFGKDAFGQLLVSVTAERNDTLSVHLGERLDGGRILRNPGISLVRYRRQLLPVVPGTHLYRLCIEKDRRNTSGDAVLMPEYIGEVLPFRYCEIEGAGDGTAIGQVAREVAVYPFDMSASEFECSDTVVNKVWDLCKYSILATSFAGVYVDGDRERIPYEADALINQLCHYGVDASYGMARRTLEHLIAHPTWPTEWILQIVMIAWEDYMYTGDDRLLRKYYDRLKNNLLLPLRTDKGLLSTSLSHQTPEFLSSIARKEAIRDIVDWPRTDDRKNDRIWNVPGESDGFEFTDYNAVVNAYHYRALVLMGKIAEALGESGDARFYAADAESFRQRFMKQFYDRRHHRFTDGVLSDTRHAALHSNMFPVAFGMTDAFADRKLAGFIRSRGMACSVYGAQFLMDAVYEMADGEYGLRLLSDTGDRGWYNMLRSGSTITTEAWDDRYKTNQDWNHAWGAVPANVIPRRLLGVTPAAPGFATADIRPQTGGLEWVRGKVPTVRGAVGVEIRNGDECYMMTVDIPSGMDADISLPSALVGGSVNHNGKMLEISGGKDKPFVGLGRFPSGRHCFEVMK